MTSPRIHAPYAAACALLFTVVFALQMWIVPPIERPTIDFATALLLQGIRWGSWLLLLPLLLRGARRRPLAGRPGIRWLARTTGTGIGFAIAHSLIASALRWLTGVAIAPGLGTVLVNGVIIGFGTGFITYWAIVIAYQAVLYHEAVRERDHREGALKLDLAHAKLNNVEATLRPHFLFNTLNAIAALVRDNPVAAEKMLGQLSELLRASLTGAQGREVALADEVALAEQYLDIERVRFGERLSVAIHMSDASRTALVPGLILQPLVENAVRHGIAPQESGGSISVTAMTSEGRLHLRVEDDGVGLEVPSRHAGTGIGLGGIRARLQHRYGSDYHMELAPRIPQGTVASIDIPLST